MVDEDKNAPVNKAREVEGPVLEPEIDPQGSNDSPAVDDTVGKNPIAALDNQNPDTLRSAHPSLLGDTETEVSKRNLDSEVGDRFVKQFVMLLQPAGRDMEDYEHEANITEIRNNILGMGLRPTADVELVSVKIHPDGVSTVATYAVPCIPSVQGNGIADAKYYVSRQQEDGLPLEERN